VICPLIAVIHPVSGGVEGGNTGMNISWPNRVAGKAVRRGAARAGIVGIAALTVAGAVALTAPAMSAMAAPLNATTTVVTNPFPITEPVNTPATVDVTVTDDTAGGPAPTGTVAVTTDVPWADNGGLPPGTVIQCATPAALTPLADWTSEMTRFWEARFDSLEDLLKRMDQ